MFYLRSERGSAHLSIVFVLVVVVIATGAILTVVKMNSMSSEPEVLKEQAVLGGEEDKLSEEWQDKIDEAESQLLVLEQENQRLKENNSP